MLLEKYRKISPMSLLQNSGWMSGNPTLSLFLDWDELHGGSMERNSSTTTGRSGEANRRSRVLQEAHMINKSRKHVTKLDELPMPAHDLIDIRRFR